MVPDRARLTIAEKLLASFRHPVVGSSPKGVKLSTISLPAPQQSPAGWPISRDAFARQLDDRLHGRNLPSQVSTQYCGIAAFLYCLLMDRPDLYAAYAIAAWSGEPFSFASRDARVDVTVRDGTRQALGRIQQTRPRNAAVSDLDWMTMASLNGATHLGSGTPPSVVSPGDQFRAITWPWMIRRWFAAVGARPRLDSVGIGFFCRSTSDLLDLLELWDGHWLVVQIDASLLEGGGQSITKRHWVVVDPRQRPLVRLDGPTGPVLTPAAVKASLAAHPFGKGTTPTNAYSGAASARTQATRLDAGLTNMKLVTWGQEHYPIPNPTLGSISQRFYSGFAFPRLK